MDDSSTDGQSPAVSASVEPDFPLPRFLLHRSDGMFVDLAYFTDSADFQRLIERLLAAGFYFRGIEHAAFSSLMFDYGPGALAGILKRFESERRPTIVRWAMAFARFDPARAALYRAVRIENDEAEYLFEPAVLEVPTEVSVASADGSDPAIEIRMVEQPTKLDFDEFVVQMWLKGVRFGLCVDEVRHALAHDFVGRMVVARGLAPTAGADANVVELAEGLHRDDAPRVLGDGRADLTQFRNRFPQIRKGVRLIRKLAAVPGSPGRKVSGEEIPAPEPKDFALADLAGPGTALGKDRDVEFIEATINGFLMIDRDTNQISITEKIINKDGVSVRTTGNLSLMGDEYEEYGEIQEKRTVEGRSITTHADVFGRLVSAGGTITIKHNLCGGSALNRDGPIIVEGLASGAQLSAPGGEIQVRRAESCVLSARKVSVLEQAVACDIEADEVHVADAAGCAVAGARIEIAAATAKSGAETLVSIVLPDLQGFQREAARLESALEALQLADERARATSDRARANADVETYLKLANRLRSGELQLKPQQKPAFEALARKAAPILKALGALGAEVEARKAQREALLAEQAQLETRRREACAAVSCSIGKMDAGVIVRTIRLDLDAPPLRAMPPGELHLRLRGTTAGSKVISDQGAGAFEWHWEPDAEADV